MVLNGSAALLLTFLVAPSDPFLIQKQRAGGFEVAQRWEELSPDDRERAMENYRRYKELPREKQEDVDRRYERWKSLPNTDRERIRRKYQDGHKDAHNRGVLGD
jgi:hypothetical protein